MYVSCQFPKGDVPLPFHGMTFQTTISNNQILVVFNNCKTYEGSQIWSLRKFHQLQNKTPKRQTPADWVMRQQQMHGMHRWRS